MANPNHYDVILIGSGAGGGTLAHKLAPTGKKILVVERGDYVPREKDNWNSRAVNLEGKYQTKETWHDKDGNPLHPHTNYCVGGNTKFFGAALFRLRKEDFGEIHHPAEYLPRGLFPMKIWSPTTRKLSISIASMAIKARIQRSPDEAAPIPFPPSATSRGFNNWQMILNGWVFGRFIRP